MTHLGALMLAAGLVMVGQIRYSHAQASQVPAAEVYQLDATHSELEFGARLFGLGRVKGAFRAYNGTLLYDRADPTRSHLSVIFQTASIDTDNKARDEHLRSPDFLDTEHYPLATFDSRRIERAGDGYCVQGDLKLRGQTRSVAFTMTTTGAPAADHVGNARLGFAGRLELKRKDFGIAGGDRFNPNFVMSAAISDDVVIDLDLLLVRWNYAGWSYRGDRPSIAASMERTIATTGIAQAIAQFSAARTAGRDSLDFTPINLLVLGHKLLAAGRVNAAVRVFDLYAEEDPRSARALWSLALAHHAAGDRSAALAALGRGMVLDSTDTVTRVLLRRLQKGDGKRETLAPACQERLNAPGPGTIP